MKSITKILKRLGTTCLLATILSINAHGTGETTAGTTTTKPNIIIVLTDDMGYGDISSFSDALKVKTPHIDRMAKEGRKFTQFYVASPICSPSRAAILSGTFAPENHLTSYLQTRAGNAASHQNDYMDPARAYLPRSFQAAGYATAHIGKWHLGGGRDVDNAPSILKYGYDEAYSTWESPNRDPKLGTNHAPWDAHRTDPGQVPRHERTAYMVDRTLDFIKRHQGKKPCFVTLWPDDLHLPFRPSPEARKKHGGKEGADNGIRNFHAVLEEYDHQMGRLLDGLDDLGAGDNTILIFTGDNGPAPHYGHTRTDGMRGMKLSLYEGGIRQPFIIRWPGKIPADTTNTSTVLSAVDLMPTLAALAGIDLLPEAHSAGLDGGDLSSVVLGSPRETKRDLMWEHGRTPKVPRPKNKKLDHSPSLAIRRGDFKLLMEPDGSGKELYNIVQDPNEANDLAADESYSPTISSMADALTRWHKSLPQRTHPAPKN